MSEPLALKYRPRTWRDVIGQPTTQITLKKMVEKDEVHPVLLFDGSRGTGKTTTARILAAALNCEAEKRPCAECASCKAVYDGSSLSVIEMDAASNGLVDDMRQVRELISYGVPGLHRVVLLDEAHSMSKPAQNAMLKTFEEPPDNVTFVLLTTEPQQLLDTIYSRSFEFPFRRISVKDIVGRLRYIADEEKIEADESLLFAIAERANGGMRDAVMTLDQVTKFQDIRTAEQFRKFIGEMDFAPSLISAMSAGDLAQVFQIIEEQMSMTGDSHSILMQIMRTFIDILNIKSGGEIIRQGEALEARRKLAASLDVELLTRVMKILWQLRMQGRLGEDARALIELAAVLITEEMSKGKRSTTAVTTTNGKLSLSAMKSLSL